MPGVHLVGGVARLQVRLARDGLRHVDGGGRGPPGVELPERLARRPARAVEVVDEPDDVVLHALELADRHAELHARRGCGRPTCRTPPGSRPPCTRTGSAAPARARAGARPSPGARARRGASSAGTSTFSKVTSHCHERKPGSRRADTPRACASTSSRLDVVRPLARPHGDDAVGSRGGVRHEELGAVEPIAAVAPLRRERDAVRPPRRVRLRDGHREDRARRSPRREEPRALLLGARPPAPSARRAPPELKNGPGSGPRPSSSYSTAASLSEPPLPPCSAGITMPEPAEPAGLSPQRPGSSARLGLLQRDDHVLRAPRAP